MVYQERTRRRLRLGGLLLVVLGLGALGFGLMAPSLAPDTAPVPVPVGAPTPLPDPGPFGGTVALYGLPGIGTTTGADQLVRCGLSPAGRLSHSAAETLDRRVVGDRAFLPLLKAVDAPGEARLTCDGDPTLGGDSLYLITTTGQRDLVPMAAFSLATLALALGVAAGVSFRPID